MSNVIVSGVSVVLKADKAIAKAVAGQLSQLASHLKDAPAVTGAIFDSQYREEVKAAFLSGGVAEASIGPAISRYKVATIALTNGVKPAAGESLKVFAGRVLDEIKARGWYVPKTGSNGGRPKGATGGAVAAHKAEKADAVKADKAGKAATGREKEAAALLLAGGDKLKAEVYLSLAERPDVLAMVRKLLAVPTAKAA